MISLDDKLNITKFSQAANLSRPTIYKRVGSGEVDETYTRRDAIRLNVKYNNKFFLTFKDLYMLFNELNDVKEGMSYKRFIKTIQHLLKLYATRSEHTTDDVLLIMSSMTADTLLPFMYAYDVLKLDTTLIHSVLETYKECLDKYGNSNYVLSSMSKENDKTITSKNLIQALLELKEMFIEPHDYMLLAYRTTLALSFFEDYHVPKKSIDILRTMINETIKIHVANLKTNDSLSDSFMMFDQSDDHRFYVYDDAFLTPDVEKKIELTKDHFNKRLKVLDSSTTLVDIFIDKMKVYDKKNHYDYEDYILTYITRDCKQNGEREAATHSISLDPTELDYPVLMADLMMTGGNRELSYSQLGFEYSLDDGLKRSK